MAGLTGLYPFVISRALDMFAAHDPRILYQVPALVVLITALKAASQYGQTLAVQNLVLIVIRGLQGKMFAHLIRADVARIEREAPAQLAARFTTDAVTIREAMIRAVNALGDSVTVVSLVVAMIYMDWELSLIAALLYPVAARADPAHRQAGATRLRRHAGADRRHRRPAQRELRAGAHRARVSSGAGRGAARRPLFDLLHTALLRITRGRARVDPVLEVLGGTAVAAVLGFAGWRASSGGATLGDFSGFVASLLLASRPLRALGSLNAAVQEGLAGLVRIFGVIDEPPDVSEAPDAVALPEGRGHLRFEDVWFVYPDGREGLRGLEFDAAPGLTVALVGPSGAGKSTALSLIPRLHDTSGGRILLDGIDLRRLRLADLRGTIAYVSQDTLLFDTSVGANIRMGRPEASEAAVRAAARAAAAEEFIDALPDGFGTRVAPWPRGCVDGSGVSSGMCGRSCVELLKMANEAVDALFAMGLPVPLGVVRSLVEGVDGILQRCLCPPLLHCLCSCPPAWCAAAEVDEPCKQRSGAAHLQPLSD